MENRTISFEDLPQATSALQGEVQALRCRNQVIQRKGNRGRHDWYRRGM